MNLRATKAEERNVPSEIISLRIRFSEGYVCVGEHVSQSKPGKDTWFDTCSHFVQGLRFTRDGEIIRMLNNNVCLALQEHSKHFSPC